MENVTVYYKDVTEKINKFLRSTKSKIEIRFRDGFFVELKKYIKKDNKFLEIHTSGYDDVLPIDEAVVWLQWTLYDYKANGIIG